VARPLCYAAARMSTLRPSSTPFVTQVRVRYADTDAEGVVYYGTYLTYFEVARVELLRHLGCPIGLARERGLVFPAVQADLRYHRPGRVDDLLDLRLWLGRRRKVTFDFTYEVCRGDELLVSGTSRHAAVDVESFRAAALPGWFVELWDRAGESIGSVM
jgi:acyl-CoA thioester hydrolase